MTSLLDTKNYQYIYMAYSNLLVSASRVQIMERSDPQIVKYSEEILCQLIRIAGFLPVHWDKPTKFDSSRAHFLYELATQSNFDDLVSFYRQYSEKKFDIEPYVLEPQYQSIINKHGLSINFFQNEIAKMQGPYAFVVRMIGQILDAIIEAMKWI